MKKAPHNLPAAGALGEQLTFIEPPPSCPACEASASARGEMWTEGEAYAEAYLERLHADVAQPGELAVILAFLCGEMLHGAARVIERALGVRHA